MPEATREQVARIIHDVALAGLRMPPEFFEEQPLATADALIAAGLIPELTPQFAIQEKTFLDGDYDRLDTGAGWSDRRGKRYTEAEAVERARRQRESRGQPIPTRVMRRFVTPYEPYEVTS